MSKAKFSNNLREKRKLKNLPAGSVIAVDSYKVT
jgi:hypothetical protein